VEMLDDLKEPENGVFESYSKNHNWTHKSCLWELSYAKALILSHDIDLMHKERNIAESIMSMCLDVTGFMKDNMNARKDLAALCNHPSLEAKANARGKLSRPNTPYSLKPTERKEVLRWLKILKFPYRYAENIERLMLVMFCGYFKADLWKMFAELSYFYKQICAKHVSKMVMQKLEKEITVVVCKMEIVFPPECFNSMQHLLVHLPWKAKVGGPMQFR
jgi:hypothetical protein